MASEGMSIVLNGLRVAAGSGLAIVALAVFATLLLPRPFGWSAYVVTSGSMAPTFDAGSVVLTSPVKPREVMTQDILTFADPSGGFTTHRVIGMESSSTAEGDSLLLTTKGDANEEADPSQLNPRNVVGKAEFAVPHLGYVIASIKTPLGAGALATLFLFVVFFGGSDKKRGQDSASQQPSSREAVVVR